jgi:hypothetical protein
MDPYVACLAYCIEPTTVCALDAAPAGDYALAYGQVTEALTPPGPQVCIGQ